MRPKPKNGNDDPIAHWSSLHQRRPVPIRFASQPAPAERGSAPEREPVLRAFVVRGGGNATEEQLAGAVPFNQS